MNVYKTRQGSCTLDAGHVMLPFQCHTGMVSVNNYNEFQSLECNCVKNVWHKLLPNTAVNAFGSLEDIPPGN